MDYGKPLIVNNIITDFKFRLFRMVAFLIIFSFSSISDPILVLFLPIFASSRDTEVWIFGVHLRSSAVPSLSSFNVQMSHLHHKTALPLVRTRPCWLTPELSRDAKRCRLE